MELLAFIEFSYLLEFINAYYNFSVSLYCDLLRQIQNTFVNRILTNIDSERNIVLSRWVGNGDSWKEIRYEFPGIGKQQFWGRTNSLYDFFCEKLIKSLWAFAFEYIDIHKQDGIIDTSDCFHGPVNE